MKFAVGDLVEFKKSRELPHLTGQRRFVLELCEGNEHTPELMLAVGMSQAENDTTGVYYAWRFRKVET